MIKKILWALLASIVIGFIVFYPILISMYVYLPLFIGFAGYLVVRGIEGHGIQYIWLPIVYLLNLEANLSLPMFLSIFSILFFRLVIYDKITYFKRCQICVGLLSVIMINICYIAILLGYDFMFDTTSIFIDSVLIYSFIFDLIFVVLV